MAKSYEINFSILAVFLLIVGITLIIAKLRNFNRKKIANRHGKIQSFASLPLVGPMFQIARNRNDIGKLFETWAQNHETAAKCTFFGQSFVLINSPSMLQKLLSSTQPGHLVKPQQIYSKVFVGTSGKGLFMSNVETWSPHRKVLNKAFNYEALKNYMGVFNKHARKLVSTLGTKISTKSGSSCDNTNEGKTFGFILHGFCLEVISEIVLGISIDAALEHAEHVKFHKGLNRIKELVTARFAQPVLQLDFIWNLHPYKKEMETCLDYLEQTYSKIMKKSLSEIPNDSTAQTTEIESQPKCVLNEMVKANWSQEEIVSEVATLLLGGHETISVALFFLFFLLASEPEHQRACQEEIDVLYDDLERSGTEISIESLSQLKYLDRCVKETLRMFPTAPMNWRKLETPLQLDDDITVDTGTIVFYSIWALHRNPKYFPNPGKFDPDRFLPVNCRNRHPQTYIPFSAGVRNCIGWKIAMQELTTIAAVILRYFDFSTSVKLEDVKINFSFSIWPTKEPGMILTRRGQKP